MEGIYGIPESFHEEASPDHVEETAEPPATRHARPTKSVVNDRDAQVLKLVQASDGISRVAVAEKLGITSHEAYLALSRVSHTGKIHTVRRNNAHVWIPTDAETAGR